MYRSLTLIPLAVLAACASPTPPSITTDDIDVAIAENDRIDALPDAAMAMLPTTSASYTGNFGSDNLTIDGDGGYGVLGDMVMTIDFGGSNDISGTVSNLNLIEDGVLDQLLGGELDISGTTAAGALAATADGTLDAVGDDLPFRGTTDVSFVMTGTTKEDGSDTAVSGTWTGGSTSLNDDFFVVGTGTFFGTED